MLRSTIAVAVLFALASSCSDNAPKTIQGSKFQGKGYTIRNVYGWEEKTGFMGSDRMWLSPVEGPADSFRENVNVTLEEIPPGITAEKYAEVSAENFKQQMDTKGDVAYTKTKVDDLDAYVAHITHRMGGVNMVLDSYVIVDGQHAYVISCTAAEEAYDRYQPKFKEMVNTFSLK